MKVKDLWPEQKVEKVHKLAWKVGYCPDCNGIKWVGIDDPAKMLEALGSIRKTVEQILASSSEWMCKNCKLPLGSKEIAEKLPECPICGSKQAIKIEKK